MDYGLLQGIGEGLQSAVGAYGAAEERKMRQRQLDEENRRKADERELLMADKGLMKNETGKYEKSEAKKAEEAAELNRKRTEKRNETRAKFAGDGFEVDFDENDNISQVRRGLIPQKAYTPLDPISAAAKSADIKKTEAEIAKILREGGQGKMLPADKVLAVQEGQQIPTQLNDIESTIANNQEEFGPIKGYIGSKNKYNEKTQTMEAQLRKASQNFGKFMEGGVLRKEDEDKYRAMFPQLTDTPEVAQNKLMLIRKDLERKNAQDVAALGASGYDVSAFSNIKDGNSQLPKVLSQKSGGLIPEAQAAQGPKPGMVQDGYRFTGGDPANPNSWEKVK